MYTCNNTPLILLLVILFGHATAQVEPEQAQVPEDNALSVNCSLAGACTDLGDTKSTCVPDTGCVCSAGYSGALCARKGAAYTVVFIMRWALGLFHLLTDSMQDIILSKVVAGGVKVQQLRFLNGSIVVTGEASIDTETDLYTVADMASWLPAALDDALFSEVLGALSPTTTVVLSSQAARGCPLPEGASRAVLISSSCVVLGCSSPYTLSVLSNTCARHETASGRAISFTLLTAIVISTVVCSAILTGACYYTARRRLRPRRRESLASPKPFASF
eukprot:TRINITY_DN829_c1_g2_i1.p1 TRINITY_DN829_c1_g2~~TRINITY_DN829_c1_g2_i1.p1  ORF type:complete len:286 (+),score=26.53 TRINITY_DN829_c1_g2_i1:33-860(+)